jgi:putative two-component system response regulator
MNSSILIVDDEPLNLDAMRRVLSSDYRLIYARSGQDALAAIAKHQPALVLLDIEMPDMDGYTVCQAVKADAATEHIPIIFVTSRSNVDDETRGFAVGAVDFIVKPISPPIVLARVRTHLSLVKTSQLEQSYRDAIGMLGDAGHYNDTDTGVHIWRMAAYASALAAASGWDKESCSALELAAPMHDTGKIGIPDAILRKPGKLDDSEWAVMRTHARIGHDILIRSHAPMFHLAAEVALCHHEKWNGSGYPQGLAGTAIPESARIVALADVFDALSMRRPYKDAWPLERVMATLHESSGSHFEPRLVDLFDSQLPRILEIKDSWDAREEESAAAVQSELVHARAPRPFVPRRVCVPV